MADNVKLTPDDTEGLDVKAEDLNVTATGATNGVEEEVKELNEEAKSDAV